MSWLVRFWIRDDHALSAPTSGAETDRADLIEHHSALVSDLWDIGTTGIFEEPPPDRSDRPALVAGFNTRAMAEEAVLLGQDYGVVGRVDPVDTSWHNDTASDITVTTVDGPATFSIVAGPSFGHGAHPTTAMTLDLMSCVVGGGRRFDRVLDLGTGSGVLSIAASIMGAESITAVDVDVQAVEAAKANVAANRVDVQCSTTSVQELARLGVLFDVVLANVLVTTHEEVAAAAIRTLAPGGCLVVSGFLSHQRHRVHEAYREHRPSLQESHSRISGDWRATVLAECG